LATFPSFTYEIISCSFEGVKYATKIDLDKPNSTGLLRMPAEEMEPTTKKWIQAVS